MDYEKSVHHIILLLNCYSFNVFCSLYSLSAGTPCLSVTAGCRAGLEGWCSGECDPKEDLRAHVWVCLTGAALWGLESKDHNSRFLSGNLFAKHGTSAKSVL